MRGTPDGKKAEGRERLGGRTMKGGHLKAHWLTLNLGTIKLKPMFWGQGIRGSLGTRERVIGWRGNSTGVVPLQVHIRLEKKLETACEGTS